MIREAKKDLQMRVIYDISVLGLGFYVPRARTGIFRVIENLAQELVKENVIAAFSSAFNVRSHFECIDYLHSPPLLRDIPLLKPGINEGLFRFFQAEHEWLHADSTPSLLQKILRRALNNRIAFSMLEKHILNPADLASADIYHSPFYAFPSQVRKSKKLKKVITIYDLIPVLYPKFFAFQENGIVHQVLKSIDRNVCVTCISQSTKDDLCGYLPDLDAERVFVTHLAASSLFHPCGDTETIEAVRKKLGIPEGPYVLSLSTLEPRKNITQTIKAFSNLVKAEKVSDLSLVLVGSKGWDFDEIFNEIAARQEIRNRIIVTGYVSDEDLSPLYTGATMFVYPSFYEGFGLPPLEAMQCGVPVITSNTSSLPEVVGDAGIMVAPEDRDALSQAMLEIYGSERLRQKMSADSVAQAEKFSWAKCAEQTISAYRAALAG